MTADADLVIVGDGPAGSALATACARLGIDTVLVGAHIVTAMQSIVARNVDPLGSAGIGGSRCLDHSERTRSVANRGGDHVLGLLHRGAQLGIVAEVTVALPEGRHLADLASVDVAQH